MKKLTTIILVLLPLLIWAHQDKYYIYEYDNVTVRFKTGHFFEEINNAKIIGQYAAALSKNLDYKKPILLDFIHDYGHSYKGNTYSFLCIGSEEYEVINYYVQKYDSLLDGDVYHMVPFDSIAFIKNVEKEVYSVPGFNKKKSIVVRQFAYHFDIRETLNLLSYALTNQSGVQKNSRPDTLPSYLRNMYYSFESIPRNRIDSIKSTKVSFVERALNNKVYREIDSINQNQLYYSYFSQNGKYQIFASLRGKEILLDTLEQVYSLKPWKIMPEALFVFETPTQMRAYSVLTIIGKKIKRSSKHRIEIDPFEHVAGININWLGGDMYLISYNNGFTWTPVKRLIYLKNDDVIIDDFEEYINSYRKEENKTTIDID